MSAPTSHAGAPRRLDQRGIALPLALLGLVAVSIMVTAALLTSSTEAAISSAQTDATRSLYQTEGALQRYLSQVGTNITPVQNVTLASAGNGEPAYTINVARLFRTPPPAVPTAGSGGRATFAIRAEPQPQGRSLVAMVDVSLSYVNLNINAGATLGNNTDIGGSIDINRTSNLCAQDSADQAILHAAGTSLTLRGSAKTNIGNDTATFAGGKDSLAAHVLNGINLFTLAKGAHIKFGFSLTDTVFSGLGGRPNATHSNPKLRWGCPPEMVTGCPAGTDTIFPLVAIDASQLNGTRGSVTLEGDYGQGLLVILNGDLVIRGNFRYKGIILVEGNTDIHGGSGGSGTKIEGALLGLGNLEICRDDLTGDCVNSLGEGNGNDLSSGAVIQYNKCAIDQVQNAINNRPIATINSLSFGWFELVR